MVRAYPLLFLAPIFLSGCLQSSSTVSAPASTVTVPFQGATSAANLNGTSIKISWSAAPSSAANLRIFSVAVDGSSTAIATIPATLTSYINTGLTANTQYSYIVQSVDGSGHLDGNQNIVTAMTYAGVTSAVSNSTTSTTFNFPAPAMSSGVNLYCHYLGETDTLVGSTSNSSTSSLTITSGLIPETYYTCHVQAVSLLTGLEDTNTATISLITSPGFNFNWNFNPASSYTYGSTIDSGTATNTGTATGIFELTPSSQADNSSNSFHGGTSTGVAFSSGALQLGNSGGCDGSAKNCHGELDSSWAPQWSHLIGLYHLNEASGASSIADSSTQGNTGIPTSVTLGVSGKLNTAATFGSGSYVSTANFADNLSSFTVSAWFKTTNGSASSGSIASKISNWSTGEGWALGIYSGTVRALLQGSGGATYIEYIAAPTYSDGYWHHVVWVMNGVASNTLYIDGVSQTLTPSSAGTVTSFTNTNSVRIGNDYGNDYFSGSIDEVAIWNTNLSASDAASIYNRQVISHYGSFASRVMDGAYTSAPWTNFAWTTTLPFGKELPDAPSPSPSPPSESVSTYSSLTNTGTGLMTGIIGLWHLDEPSGSATVADSSGQGNNGTPWSSNVTLGVPGRFNTGAYFNGTSTSYIQMNSKTITEGLSAMTVSAWVKGPAQSGEVAIVSQMDNSNIDFGLVMFTGLPYFVIDTTGSGVVQVNAPGTYNTITSNPLTDSNWHHFVGTYDGAHVLVYIDGVGYPSGVGTPATGTIQTTAVDQLEIGRYYAGGTAFTGSIDEVAIWNRGLSPAEVLQLYQRGASRIKFQIKSCAVSDPTCAIATWQGPDGTANTFFSELFNMGTQGATPSGAVQATGPSMTLANFTSPPSNNRYFQYQAFLESDSSTTALMPQLQSVSVTPVHYDSSSPTVVSNSGINIYSLSHFAETASCASGIGYNLGVGTTAAGATWYWWNGSAWVAANGTAAQSNLASVIQTNSAAFSTTVNVWEQNIYLKAYLNSSGLTPCQLTNVNIQGQ